MIIFLISHRIMSHRTIRCDPSSEPSRQDGSDDGSQHVFMQNLQKLSLIIKKYSLLSRALLYFFFFFCDKTQTMPSFAPMYATQYM